MLLRILLLSFCLVFSAFGNEVEFSDQARDRMAFFMVRHQDIVKNNKKNFKRLLSRLKKDQIIGLELLVAAATKARIESRFGHTLLRFVDKHGVAGDDIVLSFVADLDSPNLSSRRGIFGGYPVYPLLKTFRMFNRDYVKNDERALERHIIPTSLEMRKDLIFALESGWSELMTEQKALDEKQSEKAKKKAIKKAHRLLGSTSYDLVALKSEESGSTYAWAVTQEKEGERKIHHVEPVKLEVAFSKFFGKYKFLSNNCAGALINFLKKVKYPNRGSLLWAGRVPVKIPVYFEKSLLNPLPKKLIPSLAPLKAKLKKLLKVDELEDTKSWPKNAFEIINPKISLVEKIQILDAFVFTPEKIQIQLRDSLPPYRERPRYDEVYGLKTHPEVLYSTCENKSCARDYMGLANSQWTEKELETKRRRLKRLLKKIRKDKLKKKLKVRPEIVQHFKTIYLEI